MFPENALFCMLKTIQIIFLQKNLLGINILVWGTNHCFHSDLYQSTFYDLPTSEIFEITYQNFRASLVAQLVKNLPAMQETWVWSWVGKIPWRREWQPAPLFLPGESPWKNDPGGVQSTELQRVRHDWATSLSDYINHSLCDSDLSPKQECLSPTSSSVEK